MSSYVLPQGYQKLGGPKPHLEVLEGNGTGEKPKFAIDIDSTLYSFETAAREAFQKLYDETGDRNYLKGLYHSWDEWRSPADACGIEIWMKVIGMCHVPEIIERQVPFPGAVATLQALVDEGYQLMYLSTRTPEASEATCNWLDNCGFPMGDQIEVHCRMEDKGPYLAECQYLIDDRPKTLIEFIYDPSWNQFKGERKALSLLYPYNRALTDVPNIFLAPSWVGISSWLVRKGLLSAPTYQPLEV